MLFSKQSKVSKEFAKVIDWVPKWSPAAPMPQVFSNGLKTYLIYLINMPDPDWDGTYVTSFDNTSETNYNLALVEFSGHTFRFGIANDEVFNGLPLWGRGLESYEAHIIENSIWMEELKRIHKVHPYYKEERWDAYKHYSLLFHDEIFEVIATDYKIEIFNKSYEDLAIEVAERMNKRPS